MFDTKLGDGAVVQCRAAGRRRITVPVVYLPIGVHAMYNVENRETFFRHNATFTELVAPVDPVEVARRCGCGPLNDK
eukprot:87017-Prorocentrum_minimum.AAC.1